MKNRLRELVLITALVSVCLVGAAGAGLAERIDGIIRHPSQNTVQFSVHNMKIIVTAAALKLLGPDYEFRTKVGLCDDTLVVIGSGDPLLGDKVTDTGHGRLAGWIFKDIVEKLKAREVKSVKDIVVDATVFDDERVHPSWPEDQLNKWFACEVAGLNYNDNCIEMTARTINGRVTISIEPQTDFVQITNQAVATKQDTGGVGAYRQPGKPNHLLVKGKCKTQEGPFDVAIERPAAFFGYLLAEHLLAAGINTRGQLIGRSVHRDCEFELLTEYGTPMADCLKRCNKNSLGLAAEALLKTMAAESTAGKNGSWETGRKVISKYLTDLGIGESEFYIDDGSGLSRQNELSAKAITRVLREVYQGGNWKLYKESLAVGGVDGTIKRYFQQEKYRGKVFGKTGYISGVKSFSGVCSTAQGDYIFSILANKANWRSRTVINSIVEAVIDEGEQGSEANGGQ
ncbi:MAG: D-alanyl-D-alanine carboxypeptidase/D-alanyl-D-alanine endopeptidase [Planctomycetota bacterium]|jgi:D-alanyl-D-alanine carboxypeptidase/D-alanyl-D-alanine-endopeptidase (penicillin-binding protein 4)